MVNSPFAMVAEDKETTMTEKRPQYLTYRELAQVLNLPLGTLYHRVSRKEIPHVRLGRRLVRFDVEEIGKWLKAQEVTTTR